MTNTKTPFAFDCIARFSKRHLIL